jgi:hypothetical protein
MKMKHYSLVLWWGKEEREMGTKKEEDNRCKDRRGNGMGMSELGLGNLDEGIGMRELG